MNKAVLVALAIGALANPLGAQQLRIYCENDPPAQFIGPDGRLSGFAVELVLEIQARVKNTDPIEMVPWARGLKFLDSGPHVVLFEMVKTADRGPRYQWVGPVGETDIGFYSKADSKLQIASLDDAKKAMAIGVPSGDVREQFLTKSGFTNLLTAYDTVTCIKKLMEGEIDLFAGSSDTNAATLKSAGYKPEDVKSLFTFLKTQIFIAMSKDMPLAVVRSWNRALVSMRNDGTFLKILKKYFPNEELPDL